MTLRLSENSDTTNPTQFPATKAIVKFGDQAIAKLEIALQEKPPGIRLMIGKYCILSAVRLSK
ncbi:MAG: hypothetical protein QOH71_557 [Blastocatellia bacterium]|jgi:hypothetical protein|nr:hypothetical protein [Blastocatellia bacterium]